jgi:hypothetical protein
VLATVVKRSAPSEGVAYIQCTGKPARAFGVRSTWDGAPHQVAVALAGVRTSGSASAEEALVVWTYRRPCDPRSRLVSAVPPAGGRATRSAAAKGIAARTTIRVLVLPRI